MSTELTHADLQRQITAVDQRLEKAHAKFDKDIEEIKGSLHRMELLLTNHEGRICNNEKQIGWIWKSGGSVSLMVLAGFGTVLFAALTGAL